MRDDKNAFPAWLEGVKIRYGSFLNQYAALFYSNSSQLPVALHHGDFFVTLIKEWKMRKIIIGCIIYLTALSGYAAETCIGGVDWTYRNGHTYCLSDSPMNWWSAFQWCAAQSRHLATLDEICDYEKETWRTTGLYCPNKNIIDSKGRGIWSALGNGEGTAYTLHIGGGNISTQDITQHFNAFCY